MTQYPLCLSSAKPSLNFQKRTYLFLGVVAAVTIAGVGLVTSEVIFTEEFPWISLIWIAGFGFLFFNVSFLFILSLIRPFLKTLVLKETAVKEFPKIAMVYPVRNESHGLFERIHYSFSGNAPPHTDLWILSDSTPDHEAFEKDLVIKLGAFHPGRVFYRRRENPVEHKQGNLAEFVHSHPEYAYVYICDADGMVPESVLLKLLRKAEHPENQDIAIFQAWVKIAHARTWYARFERIGTDLTQRFNFVAYQAIFGQTISFGHHQLARRVALSKIKLPTGLLSHDNWDTVLLDRMGYRVAFCADVSAFDEAPANYLEARARSRRWTHGTLQGIPLLWMRGVTPAIKFLTFYGIYLYIADLVFFSWVILGILSHSYFAWELIHFKIDSIWFGLFTNNTLNALLFFSVAVVYLHKVSILRSLKDLREYLYELTVSTLLTLNNFIYTPLDIVSIPLRKLYWKPMAKDPHAKVDIKRAARELCLGTAFGLGALYFCLTQTPYFIWPTTPVLTSLILSIPVAYWTAQPMPEQIRRWI